MLIFFVIDALFALMAVTSSNEAPARGSEHKAMKKWQKSGQKQRKLVESDEASRRQRKLVRSKTCDPSFVEATTPAFRVVTELFHEPLFDRTQTVGVQSVESKIITPIPEFDASAKDRTIADIARERARELWARAGELPSREMEVLFSGGIDSTSSAHAARTSTICGAPRQCSTRSSPLRPSPLIIVAS